MFPHFVETPVSNILEVRILVDVETLKSSTYTVFPAFTCTPYAVAPFIPVTVPDSLYQPEPADVYVVAMAEPAYESCA